MSETREIQVTQLDHDRLWRMIGRAGEQAPIQALEEELDRATVVPSQKVEPDVVTMNSRLEVEDLDRGDRKTITVVFPDAAAAAEGKVSVLAPLGLAVLGARAGQILEWQMPGGRRRLHVRRVLFQPEAAGLFDL